MTKPPGTTPRKQNTLSKEVTFSGIGVHTGLDVTMTFRPAPAGTGIIFRRVDLPGDPEIPARLEYVQDTARCTTIGVGDVCVKTIEHVLAALFVYHIDNLYVDVTAEEPPVGNGSSDIFVEMIESVGITPQNQETQAIAIQEPVHWSEGDLHIVALPSDNLRVSYTLSYPQSTVLRAQYHSTIVNVENFKKEIASCRTFSLYEEISPLMDRGLIKGGSLQNAVVIQDDVVFSKEGLHFPDEMVRHKVLDLIGDVSLVGYQLCAHIIAIKSGHTANFAFSKKLYELITTETSHANASA